MRGREPESLHDLLRLIEISVKIYPVSMDLLFVFFGWVIENIDGSINAVFDINKLMGIGSTS